MTEIRETGFRLDLPGQWAQTESTEPGNYVYAETGGSATVSVMLLAVRPVYALADSKRLVQDYMHHRIRYEQGQLPTLDPSESATLDGVESVEGEWAALDLATGDRVRHRVILAGTLLGDFRYSDSGLDEAAFNERAETVLGTGQLTPT